MRLAVVGLGLIGGSMALDLRGSGFVTEVIGVENNMANANRALRLELVSRIDSLENACKEVNLVILACPVTAITKILPNVLDLISEDTMVTDVGSTKFKISESVKNHPRRKNFVLSHPMSGTEHSGPDAAHRGLFKDKIAVICDEEKSSTEAVQLVEAMYKALKMKIIRMDSKPHDLHAAYVSHLSHISSIVLANTVLDKEKNEEAIFNLASGGFESTVRLAKSSPDTWTPIFEQNQEFVVQALGAYIERLQAFQQSLVSKDYRRTWNYIDRANEIKRVLLAMGKKNGA